MTELAFHGIHTSRLQKAKSVTHVSGTNCHLCLGPLKPAKRKYADRINLPLGSVLANRLPKKGTTSVKKIDVGITSAGDHVRMHAAAAYSRFQKVSNRENAMSLASALWDTAGWLWSDQNPGVDRRKHPDKAKAFDDDLFKRCPDLELIRAVAETMKHGGELHRGSVTVTAVSGSGSPGGTSLLYNPLGPMGERASGPFGMPIESTPECTLRIDHDGGSRDMKKALAASYKFLLAETAPRQ
jgi:hypothetical protein